jgi:hypothetical protein
MNTRSLLAAIERMIDELPHWREDAVIYQYACDGTFACDPRSTYDTVSREHETIVIFECHDLNDIFPDFGNCEDDAAWLLAEIINEQLGTDVSSAAAIMGRKGGQSTSEAKKRASRENGRLGGRPKK